MNIENTPGSQSPEDREFQENASPDSPINDAQNALDHDQHRDLELAPGVRAPETTVPVSEHQAAELQAPTTETMAAYLEWLEIEYRHQLAEQFTLWLRSIDTAEIEFIRGDEILRNKTAFVLHEFGIDRAAPYFGEYRRTSYVARNPEIAQRAMELYGRAVEVDESFQARAAEIARSTGSMHIPGPIKDIPRIAEKMERDYLSGRGDQETDLDQLSAIVKDVARCRLVVDGNPIVADEPIIAKIEEIGLRIAEDGEHRPLIKRSFRDRHTGEPTPIETGVTHRDTKVTVTVEVPTSDGDIALCEIAIVTPEMATATVFEHPIYEITRSLDGDERPTAVTLLSKLRRMQREFYGEVSQQISTRLSTT